MVRLCDLFQKYTRLRTLKKFTHLDKFVYFITCFTRLFYLRAYAPRTKIGEPFKEIYAHKKKIYALSESRVNIESESDCSDNDSDF